MTYGKLPFGRFESRDDDGKHAWRLAEPIPRGAGAVRVDRRRRFPSHFYGIDSIAMAFVTPSTVSAEDFSGWHPRQGNTLDETSH